MNFGEAVTNIAKKLGNRTDLDESIKAEIKLAQAELEASRTLPWFLLQEELILNYLQYHYQIKMFEECLQAKD
jgi:hypothetical protein